MILITCLYDGVFCSDCINPCFSDYTNRNDLPYY